MGLTWARQVFLAYFAGGPDVVVGTQRVGFIREVLALFRADEIAILTSAARRPFETQDKQTLASPVRDGNGSKENHLRCSCRT